MSLRRHSLETGHHAIPQAGVASNPVILNAEEAQQFDGGTRPPGTVSRHSRKTRYAYFILGAAMLMGWNVMINSIPYFSARLKGSSVASAFGSYLSVSSTIANFATLWYATITSKRRHLSSRILRSIYATVLLNGIFAFLVFFDMVPGFLFAIIILDVIGQAAAAAYLQTAVMALASLFGSASVQAVMSGQAAVGVAVSILELFSALGSARSGGIGSEVIRPEHRIDWGAFAFFSAATIFLVGSIFAQISIAKTKLYRTVLNASMIDDPNYGETEHLVQTVSSLASIQESDAYLEPNVGRTFTEMLWLNRTYNFSVSFVFIVTLSVFPPLTTSITSVNTSSGYTWTIPIVFHAIHFLLFNIGDLLGRYIPAYPHLFITHPRKLLVLSLSRIVFVPLFLLCNINSKATPLFNSDLIFFGLVFLLGLSNGYASSAIMICAPSLDLNAGLGGREIDIDTAATVASFSLSSGLVLGSIASFAVGAAVCGGCNPFTT